MFTRADFITSISQSWDFVNVQDWSGVIARTNSTSTIYSANGLGCSTATSTGVVASIAGSADQRVTATLRYVSPTISSTCNMGVRLRVKSLQNSADTHYYVARVHQGVAKITAVLAGTFGSAISQGSFALPPDTNVTIVFTAIGSALTATFRASGVPDVDLSATDTQVTGNGFVGFGATSQTCICSAMTAEFA